MDAIRAGHLYLSSGPELTTETVGASGATGFMGDVVSGIVDAITVRWAGAAEGSRLRILLDGSEYAQFEVAQAGERSFETANSQFSSVVAELRNGRGDVVAVTNPVFREAG